MPDSREIARRKRKADELLHAEIKRDPRFMPLDAVFNLAYQQFGARHDARYRCVVGKDRNGKMMFEMRER